MALTRNALKAMGLTKEQEDSIIEMHTDTTDGLKKKLTDAEAKAADYDKLKSDYDELSKKSGDGDGYKEKYEKEHKDFEDYKNSITAEKTQAAKEKAARAYFESKSIKGDNLDIAMMGIEGRLAALELDGEKLKDTKSLDELIGGKYAKLVTKEDVKGADVKNPPATGGDTKTEPVSLADALRQRYKESADKQ